MSLKKTIVLAGLSSTNAALFHRVRFLAPDASVIIDFSDGTSTYLVRDIEMDRARKSVRASQVCCAADFAPATGLSGDRDTALAQATAQCLLQAGETVVQVDRTFPFLYAHFIQEVGIQIEYAPDLGVLNRRSKDEEEIQNLRHAQKITGEAMTFACQTIAHARADREGILYHEDQILTSQRMRSMITAFLLERNFSNAHDSIVVTAPHVADCHHFGDGPLKTSLPVIVDIFPMDQRTRYNGDMTRTVVHGTPCDEVLKMHQAVCDAKAAGCQALRSGTTGEEVHLATTAIIEKNGFSLIRGDHQHDLSLPAMRHGTGHGIGLEIHEPILLDHGGGIILENEIFTVEPGLYSSTLGGVRVEDMALVTKDGHEILSPLYEGLDWSD